MRGIRDSPFTHKSENRVGVVFEPETAGSPAGAGEREGRRRRRVSGRGCDPE